MRSQSVRARRNRGADETVVPEIESMSRLLESVEPKTVNAKTRFDAAHGMPGDPQSSSLTPDGFIHQYSYVLINKLSGARNSRRKFQARRGVDEEGLTDCRTYKRSFRRRPSSLFSSCARPVWWVTLPPVIVPKKFFSVKIGGFNRPALRRVKERRSPPRAFTPMAGTRVTCRPQLWRRWWPMGPTPTLTTD